MQHPYCSYIATIIDRDDVDKMYHDHAYGVRILDDNELFCRLVMEINQAGLSWHTILVKEKNFREAYHNFSIKKVAQYKEKDFKRLINDVGIIRNRLKINAAIHNAQQILRIQKEHGSFLAWIDAYAFLISQEKREWVKLFKKHFKFVGGEIVGEFLMSIGILDGAHGEDCVQYKRREIGETLRHEDRKTIK